MVLSDKILYVQLHKTGCTHIARVLKTLYDAMEFEKHRPPSEELTESGRYILGSVRNPWDWYVSLWAFGCDGKGILKKRLTQPKKIYDTKYFVRRDIGRGVIQAIAEMRRNREAWISCYTHTNDAPAFRKWLNLMYEDSNSVSLGENYGFSRVRDNAGFLTYRYLRLYCKNRQKLYTTYSKKVLLDLESFDRKNCYIQRFIKMESLEADLIYALESAGEKVTDEQKDYIHQLKKSNTSTRELPLAAYYDEQTRKIVARREDLIIRKFGYNPPT